MNPPFLQYIGLSFNFNLYLFYYLCGAVKEFSAQLVKDAVHPHQTFKNMKYFISLKIKLVLNNYVAKMVKCSFLKEGRKIELLENSFIKEGTFRHGIIGATSSLAKALGIHSLHVPEHT